MVFIFVHFARAASWSMVPLPSSSGTFGEWIYLHNGHCIGRCWQKGPQHEYYIPECWLNIGG